jgi:3-hydroxybutyryl-CoA dehydrogenase
VSEGSWPTNVAVVGAGTMGVGIAHVFAAHAVPTALVDASPELSEGARARAVELLARLEAAGSIAAGATATAERNLTPPRRSRTLSAAPT